MRVGALLECLDGDNAAACDDALPVLVTTLAICSIAFFVTSRRAPTTPAPDAQRVLPIVVVVTGGSRGIGYQIARRICISSSNASTAATIIITARKIPSAGVAQLSAQFPECTVVGQALDVRKPSSCAELAAWVQQNYPQCNTLVNNAGVAEGPADCMAVNFYGTRNMSLALWRLLEANQGRIINVSSAVGQLTSNGSGCPLAGSCKSNQFAPAILEQLLNCKTVQALSALADRFEANRVASIICLGQQAEPGWPQGAYATSKSFETQLARVQSNRPRVGVVACCPGLCRTELSNSWGYYFAKWCFGVSAFEGADTPAWLAVCADAEFQLLNGKFVRERQSAPY